MTLVIHTRDRDEFPNVIPVGRESGLLGQGGWGNPFSHLERSAATTKVASREDAIEAYRQLLWKLLTDPIGHESLMQDLADLHGGTLACWCKPQACHGDVLVRASKWAFDGLHGGAA